MNKRINIVVVVLLNKIPLLQKSITIVGFISKKSY